MRKTKPVNPQLIVIGRIRRSFGIKGWHFVDTFTEPVDNLFNYPIYLASGEPIEIKEHKNHNKQFVALFNIPIPPSLVNQYLYTHTDHLPPLNDNQYYYYQLEGMNVINHLNQNIGIVHAVYENCQQDILVIRHNKKEWHIPLNQSTAHVDLAKQTIHLTQKSHDFF